MRTALIVDDHESVLHTLGYVFGLRGYGIRTANSGAAGIELAAEEAVDVALVDLHMPVMDGCTVCRSLREQAIAADRDLPVFMMTAAAVPALAARAVEAGAVAVLRKPFVLDEVFSLRRRVSHRR